MTCAAYDVAPARLALTLTLALLHSTNALQVLNIINLWDEIRRNNDNATAARNLCPTLLERYVKCPGLEQTLICVEYCFNAHFSNPSRLDMSWGPETTRVDTSDPGASLLLRKAICSNFYRASSCFNDLVYNCKDIDRGPVHILNALFAFGVGSICYDDRHFEAYLEWTDCFEMNGEKAEDCVTEFVINLSDILTNKKGNADACKISIDVLTCMKRILLENGCAYKSSLASNEQFVDTFLMAHLESPFIVGCLHTQMMDSLRKYGLIIPRGASSSCKFPESNRLYKAVTIVVYSCFLFAVHSASAFLWLG